MASISTSVALVGAGPIGIELAVALKRAKIDFMHIESGAIASTIYWYPAGTTFFSSPERISIAGVPLEPLNQGKATREKYLRYLRGVVRQFDLPIRLYTRVVDISREANAFRLSLQRSFHGVGGPKESEGRRMGELLDGVTAESIVLAIGDMHVPNRLGIPGEDLPHVSHYFEDPHLYAGSRVLIVGAKNSAAEAVVRLHRIGARVSLAHRQPSITREKIKPWVFPSLDRLITDREIQYIPASIPVECREQETVLQLFDPKGGPDRISVDTDFVLLLTGYGQIPELFERAGIRTIGENRRPEYDPTTMESNVPGIYIAGTACAGSQGGASSHREFIETSHVHVDRIIGALQGKRTDIVTPRFRDPES